jgi:hypothetical protein
MGNGETGRLPDAGRLKLPAYITVVAYRYDSA